MANCGMSPSLWLRGNRSLLASLNGVTAQAVTAGTVTWRRHFPICITRGNEVPAGTFCRV